jgi:aryl-alcohol dehydrogenase-like predicted oxidoreductase
MGTDHVDLYQAHNLKLPEMGEGFLRVMEKVVKSGKARHWGVALGPAIGWREEGVIALTEWADRGCVTVQTVFNMLEQHPGREFAELAAEVGKAGIIARVPHSSGILQDMYSPDEKFDDHRKFRDRNWLVYGLKKVKMLRGIQKSHGGAGGGTMGQVAIKWLLTWPAVTSVQPNIMDERELREFAAACDGDLLSVEEMREVQALAESDFGLGEEAHACDLKSSVDASGRVRSGYERGKAVPRTTTTMTT